MAKYGCKHIDKGWYVTKDDELYIECGGETVAWLIAKSLNLEADKDEETNVATDLAIRLYRYSEKTLSELTDPDFAEAVQKAIKLLTGRTGNG